MTKSSSGASSSALASGLKFCLLLGGYLDGVISLQVTVNVGSLDME